jgi:hypothetical protein
MYIPEDYMQVSPGVWEKKNKVSSFDVYNKEHDVDSFVKILNSDKIHYNRLLDLVNVRMPELSKIYNDVISIGGGIPKFETVIMNVDKVTIIDIAANWYKKQLKKFRDIYELDEKPIIEFYKEYIEKPKKIFPFDCICFIHVLEHMPSWKLVKDWIRLQDKDIVIYGPNIESARDTNWHHFGDNAIDHNVFFTIEAIEKYAKSCNYQVQSMAYSDDMLVWLRKK